MERSLRHKGATRTTEHHHLDYLLDRWRKQEGLIIMMMQSMTNTSMMEMIIRVITLIAISSKTISSHNYLRSRRQNIHAQYFLVPMVYAPLLTSTDEPGVISMLWCCISLMISGFTEESGWWGFNSRSSVWCARERASTCAELLVSDHYWK